MFSLFFAKASHPNSLAVHPLSSPIHGLCEQVAVALFVHFGPTATLGQPRTLDGHCVRDRRLHVQNDRSRHPKSNPVQAAPSPSIKNRFLSIKLRSATSRASLSTCSRSARPAARYSSLVISPRHIKTRSSIAASEAMSPRL